jgi:hypothetical protein
VTIVTRRSAIRFQTPLGERSLYDKIRAPMSALGPGWKSVLCVQGPLLFHAMPESFRVDVVRRYLGPAPAWYTRELLEGHVSDILQAHVVEAKATDAGARLTLRHADGSNREISANHVVSATGYRVDTRKLTFLSDRIQAGLRRGGRGAGLVAKLRIHRAGPLLRRNLGGEQFWPDASVRHRNQAHLAPGGEPHRTGVLGTFVCLSIGSRNTFGVEASRQ